MAVMAIFRREGVSAELYQAYRERVPVERVPHGAIAHFHGRDGDGFVSVDVWEDEDAMWRFIRERVEPATRALVETFVEPEVIQLQTVITTSAAAGYSVPFETAANTLAGVH